MAKAPKGIQITPVWRGDKIDIHVDGQIVRVAAPADGLHFAVPSACHFFVEARALWTDLDVVLDGPKAPRPRT